MVEVRLLCFGVLLLLKTINAFLARSIFYSAISLDRLRMRRFLYYKLRVIKILEWSSACD
jgi:hypothetical protein